MPGDKHYPTIRMIDICVGSGYVGDDSCLMDHLTVIQGECGRVFKHVWDPVEKKVKLEGFQDE